MFPPSGFKRLDVVAANIGAGRTEGNAGQRPRLSNSSKVSAETFWVADDRERHYMPAQHHFDGRQEKP